MQPQQAAKAGAVALLDDVFSAKHVLVCGSSENGGLRALDQAAALFDKTRSLAQPDALL